MGKIYDRLQKQLQVEEHRVDAEDCIKIYNKLKEMNDGSVWSSDWQVLTTIGGWIGEASTRSNGLQAKQGWIRILKWNQR